MTQQYSYSGHACTNLYTKACASDKNLSCFSSFSISFLIRSCCFLTDFGQKIIWLLVILYEPQCT